MNLVTVRGINSFSVIPASVRHLDLLELSNGELIEISKATSLQKLLYCRNNLYSILTEQQRLVFKYCVELNGLRVNAKLTMLAAVDYRNPNAFLRTFFRPGMKEITTGFVVKALYPIVRTEVENNLSHIDLLRVSKGMAIQNAQRHAQLTKICQGMGIHLFQDELVIVDLSIAGLY